MQPDRAETERFLAALDDDKRWTFQTFDDNAERKKERKARGEKDPFAQIMHSSLAKCWPTLVKLNAQGAGIFITVNRTDFKGRAAEDIKSVRALFVDLDGNPLDPVIAPGAMQPHIVVESSPGRWHAYWRVLPLMTHELFTLLQKSIAARFGGDPTVHDLPRVMRLPGFVHFKGEPFVSRIERTNGLPWYRHCALIAAFPPVSDDPAATAASRQSKHKSSHWGELNERALKAETLLRWVPKIFPTAKRTRAGGFRVASVDLGRGFEEDLGIDPRGIKYFGIADQGDPRGGRRTPIELVAEWQQVEAPQAADWLEKTLGSNGHDTESPEPPPPPPEPEPQKESATDTDIEITRLAKLTAVQYEHERKGAAEKLNVRASILDRLVAAERTRLGLDGADDDKQGRAISFPEPELWPEPVDGAALLNAMAARIRSHVVMSNTSSHVAALWVLHSWLINCFVISPRLCIRSATKGCGKTLMADVLGRLVRRPLRTLSTTPAATFRVVEGWQPTLLIDEADTFLNDNEGLRGILDGNRKGDTVLRTVGDDFEVRAFATYAAVVIALIGTLPDTLHDRSVVIDLKRRLPKEKITPFRFDRAGHLDVLVRMAARWAIDNAERIATIDPKMPKGVINREADNWRPLVAIAVTAGGRRWPVRVSKAATAAHAGTIEGDAASALEMLLVDIRDTFATDKAMKVRDMFGAEQIEIASAVLVKVLVGLDGRPWPEMGRDRKPLTQNRLARMLDPLKIKPGNVGPKEARVRGYRLDQFTEAFDRYLEEGSQPHTRTPTDNPPPSKRPPARTRR
jgi:hypothetical protein